MEATSKQSMHVFTSSRPKNLQTTAGPGEHSRSLQSFSLKVIICKSKIYEYDLYLCFPREFSLIYEISDTSLGAKNKRVNASRSFVPCDTGAKIKNIAHRAFQPLQAAFLSCQTVD